MAAGAFGRARNDGYDGLLEEATTTSSTHSNQPRSHAEGPGDEVAFEYDRFY